MAPNLISTWHGPEEPTTFLKMVAISCVLVSIGQGSSIHPHYGLIVVPIKVFSESPTFAVIT